MMVLFFLILSLKELRNGFNQETIYEPITYELRHQIFFFKFMAHENQQRTNVSISIFLKNNQSAPFRPEPGRFYQLKGDKILITPDKNNLTFYKIVAESKICDDYVIALSLTNYINVSYGHHNISSKLCYIFYEPNADYRVTFDCLANNRDTLCQIHSKASFMGGDTPSTCQSNSTMEKTLGDGFIATIQGKNDGSSVMDTTAKVLAVKGQNSALICDSYAVDVVDFYGIHSFPIHADGLYCQPAIESVLIAIVLVGVLVFVLVGGVLTYYKCRPNREAYESDEGARRKRINRKHRTSELLPTRHVRKSEAGLEQRRDMLTPLC